MVYKADLWQRVVDVSWSLGVNQFYNSTEYLGKAWGFAVGDPGGAWEGSWYSPAGTGSTNAYSVGYVMRGGPYYEALGEQPIDFVDYQTLADVRGARLTAVVGGGSIAHADESWSSKIFSQTTSTGSFEWWVGGTQVSNGLPQIETTQYGSFAIFSETDFSSFSEDFRQYQWIFGGTDFPSAIYNQLRTNFPQSTPADQRTLRITW